MPEFLSGGKNWPDDPILFGFGVSFGLVWVIVPLLLFYRTFKKNNSECVKYSLEDQLSNGKKNWFL